MSRWLAVASLLLVSSSPLHASAPHSAASPDSQVRGIVQRVQDQLSKSPAASEVAPAHAAHSTPVKPAAARTASLTQAPAAARSATAGHAADPTDPEGVWEALLAGNRRFVDSRPIDRPLAAQRTELAKGQHPHAIVLTCADSRVGPELVFDQSLGDLFVVRTAGNVADAVALGSLEYAVEHLHTHLLVVLGHEKCGAVRAALEPGDMPTVNLQAIVDRIRPATEKPRGCFEGEELVSRCVATNVMQSARDLATHSPILRDHLARQDLVIKRAVYDLRSGLVTTLE